MTVHQNDNTSITTSYTNNGKVITGETVYSGSKVLRKTNYSYDVYGRLTKKTVTENNESQITEYEYDDPTEGYNYTVTETKKYCLDTNKQDFSDTEIVSISEINGLNGNIISITDANGNMAKYSYYDDERVSGIGYYDKSDTDKEITSVGYVYNEAISTTFTNEEGIITKTSYDAYGRTTTVQMGEDLNNLHITKAATYDNRSNIKTSTDGNGNITTYTYDDLNRLTSKSVAPQSGDENVSTSETDPSLTETYSYSYSTEEGTDNPTVTTIYSGAGSETVTYDHKGREIKRTDGNGNSIVTKYDYMNNKVAITDGKNNTTQFEYEVLSIVFRKFVSAKMKFLAGKPGEGAAKPRLSASLHIPAALSRVPRQRHSSE